MNLDINCQVIDCPSRRSHPSGNGFICGNKNPITISPDGGCAVNQLRKKDQANGPLSGKCLLIVLHG